MERFIEEHSDECFDILVIGGGITGASVAYEAATRGLKVALLEMDDFAGGTSSASSKLIHGGLRYLANGEIGMVRESLRERRVLSNIAPNFVYPMPVLMPHTDKSFKNNKWALKLGMLIYDALSFDKAVTWDSSKRIPMHRTLSSREVLRREPQVRAHGLTGASVFYDCLSLCPERLTLAFVKSAVRYGAKVANHAQVVGFHMDGEHRISGVRVRDVLCGAEYSIRGTITINCAGPWADIVLGLASANGEGGRTLSRSEGVHVITSKNLIAGQHIVGCVDARGSHFFLIPWRGHTLIGTTDKRFNGEPDAYRVSTASVMELIEAVTSAFGDGTLCYEDVEYAYGGLRPLVEVRTKETYSASRRYEICDNARQGLDGLITVEGGKFTTSRKLAEQCLRVVAAKLGRPLGKSTTDKQRLFGCTIPDLQAFLDAALQQHKDFQASTISYLSRTYGTEYEAVLQLAREDENLACTLDADGEILAQVIYAIRQEMARTLADIVFRRTGICTLGNPGDKVIEKIALLAATELGWNKNRVELEIANTQAQFCPPPHLALQD